MNPIRGFRQYWSELRRRRVIRAAVIYVLVANGIMAAIDQAANAFQWANEVWLPALVTLVVLFPVVLIVAWAVEVTDEGAEFDHAPEGSPHLTLTHGVASVVALVLATALFGWSARTIWSNPDLLRPDAEGSGAPPSSVAILDLDDLSPGGDLGYLASGLAEDLTHDLTNVRGLDVRSRTAVRAVRTQELSVDEIGQELSVGTLVEGSVAANEETVRVTIQMIDVASGTHLLSREIEARRDEPLALRDELGEVIFRELRDRLKLAIDTWEDRQQTASSEAWILYAKGIEHELLGDSLWSTDRDGTLMEWDQAIEYFARARAEDPDWYCPIVREGWLALRASRTRNGDAPGRLMRSDSATLFQLAREAVEISDGAANALEFRGALSFEWTEAYPTDSGLRTSAEADLAAALSRNPNLPRSLVTLGALKKIDEDFETAEALIRRAIRTDAFLELPVQTYYALSMALVELREMEDARVWCDQGREEYPDEVRFHMCDLFVGSLADQPVSPDQAWAIADTIRGLAPAYWDGNIEIWAEATVARLLARWGMIDSALSVLADLSPQLPDHPALTYTPASAYLEAGDTLKALELLETYVNVRPNRRAYLRKDWLFEGIQDHWRFIDITDTSVAETGPPSR